MPPIAKWLSDDAQAQRSRLACCQSAAPSGPPGLAQALYFPYISLMTIVTYTHRRKEATEEAEGWPASALAVPTIVTHKRRRGPKPPIELESDPEGEGALHFI